MLKVQYLVRVKHKELVMERQGVGRGAGGTRKRMSNVKERMKDQEEAAALVALPRSWGWRSRMMRRR